MGACVLALGVLARVLTFARDPSTGALSLRLRATEPAATR
jgi:hypothetical protein